LVRAASFISSVEVGRNSGLNALVHLGRNEVQPFDQAIALQRAVGGRQLAIRRHVGDELDDGRAFGQHGAILQLQGGHIAFRVDRQEVGAAGGLAARGCRPVRW
jgi:hypothetical protein